MQWICDGCLSLSLAARQGKSKLTLSGVRIPETVEFVSGHAKYWYYFNGEITRYEKIDNILVEEHFSKETCVWIQGSGEVSFRYLNPSEMVHFFRQMDHTFDGVLQKFIWPRSASNEVLKVFWSRHNLTVESIKNKYPITANIDLTLKACTFEQPNNTILIPHSALYRTLGKLTANIVKMVNLQTHLNVLSITLHFKMDKNNEPILLFCDHIKPKERPQLKPPSLRLKTYMQPHTDPIRRCISCKETKSQNLFEEITLKEVIKSWDINHNFSFMKLPKIITIDHDFLIPKIIRFIYPEMNYQQYQQFKITLPFHQQVIQICYSCYLQIKNNKSLINNQYIAHKKANPKIVQENLNRRGSQTFLVSRSSFVAIDLPLKQIGSHFRSISQSTKSQSLMSYQLK